MIATTAPNLLLPGNYKALTLWQPWATLIATGIKKYETRSWATNHRGTLLIHAAKRPMTESEERLLDVLITQFPQLGISRNPKDYPLGAIVCQCRVVDCLSTDTNSPPKLIDRMTGDWTPQRWAWELTDVEPLNIPDVAGKQGLWNFDCEKPNNSVFEGAAR